MSVGRVRWKLNIEFFCSKQENYAMHVFEFAHYAFASTVRDFKYFPFFVCFFWHFVMLSEFFPSTIVEVYKMNIQNSCTWIENCIRPRNKAKAVEKVKTSDVFTSWVIKWFESCRKTKITQETSCPDRKLLPSLVWPYMWFIALSSNEELDEFKKLVRKGHTM